MQGQEQETKFIPEIDVNVKKLPSRGVPYPKDSTLSYRTYTFGEVKNASISSTSLERSLKLMLTGLKASFNVQTLTLMDAIYIGILRKISSFNNMEFEIPYRCEACGSANKAHFSHRDIDFRDLPDEVVDLPVIVNIMDREVHFSPMTVQNFFDLKSGRYANIVSDDRDRIAVYAMMAKNMQFEEAYKFFYEVKDPDTMGLLTEVDKLMTHDMKPLSAQCKNKIKDEPCNHINKIRLEGQEALLRPFCRGEGSYRDRIRFGTASKS